MTLGSRLFASLRSRQNHIRIPSYDKSAYQGQGDRLDETQWSTVNDNQSQPPVEVIIFEGWCVGFRSLSDDQLEQKWKQAKLAAEQSREEYNGRLGLLKLEDVKFVNDALKQYDELTE